MTEKEFINKFVTEKNIEHGRLSCLMMALIDARLITGRNINTGNHELNILENKIHFLNPYSFIGIVNYLLILEMIGEIFKVPTFTINNNKTSKIYKAIMYFRNDVTEQEIYAIIALRNSLGHNYGLINIPDPRENETKRHKFTIVNSEGAKLVEFALHPWKGNFDDKFEKSSTKIGHSQIIDFIESVYKKLVERIQSGEAELALENGLDELKSRFTIVL